MVISLCRVQQHEIESLTIRIYNSNLWAAPTMTSDLNMSSPNTETFQKRRQEGKLVIIFQLVCLLGCKFRVPGRPWRVGKSPADPGCSRQRDSRVGKGGFGQIEDDTRALGLGAKEPATLCLL